MIPVSYLAVDLETTGLDPREDRILEIAWAPLDFSLNQLGPVRSYVLRADEGALARLRDNAFTLDMHSKNRLLADTLASTLDIANAEREVLNDLRAYDFSAGAPTIFGSSVHFDLRFIEAWMPTLRKALHYRVFDVSTLLAFEAALGYPRDNSTAVAHRAAADITWSIETAQRILAQGKQINRSWVA